MAKYRKDTTGHVLRKGETYVKSKKLYRFTYTDTMGVRRSIFSSKLTELREREEQMQRASLDGLDLYIQSKATLNFTFDRYIQSKTELRSTTATNYIYMYNKFVRNGFGKRLIAKIKYSDVLFFYSSLLEKGLKINTIDSMNTFLRPTFEMAVRDEIIRTNPTIGVVADLKKKTNNTAGVRHALKIEEQKAFLKLLDNSENARWKPLFVTMFGTGCRVGEIIGLRWEDVDFDKGVININHNMTYYPRAELDFKCKIEVGPPKTQAGFRNIPILDNVREVLLQEKEFQESTGLYCKEEVNEYKNFIFFNRFGNLFHLNSINRKIKRLVNTYNMREELDAKRENRDPLFLPDFSCHIIRHTFCTRLCESEVNVKVIQSILGHSDVQTTLDIYAEVSEAKKQEVVGILKNDNVF